MNQELFSEAMGKIDDKYIMEAVRYRKKDRRLRLVKWAAAAACLAAVAVIGGMLFPFPGHMAVSAYAHGTDMEITPAGAVMQSGSISDDGVMRGKPLMFYLDGKGIATVRFSCREQQLYFTDWTEKRAEYGNARNFTVTYGSDESEYYYLTIDWVPNATIRELTDHPDSSIAALPEELRNDLIVMEITFADGETATKAIEISLLDDGTFFASFDDYRVSDADAFVRRPDSEPIPREVLYAQGSQTSGIADAPPMVYVNDRLYKQSPAQTSYEEEKEEFVYLGEIESDVTNDQSPTDGLPKRNFQANHPIVGAKVWQYGENIVVLINGKYWLYESLEDQGQDAPDGLSRDYQNAPDDLSADYQNAQNSLSEDFQNAQNGLSEEKKKQLNPSYGADNNLQTAEETARAYYADTVFTIISMEPKSQTAEEIVFSVCVSKGGIVQEPDRSITLRLDNGTWTVVNEGY